MWILFGSSSPSLKVQGKGCIVFILFNLTSLQCLPPLRSCSVRAAGMSLVG